MKNADKKNNLKCLGRQRKVRAKIFGSKQKPRLSVFRSNKHIYAQIIDDEKSKTLVSASDLNVKTTGLNKTDRAVMVGEAIAKKAKELNINRVIFDRGSFKYHGKVKALADSSKKSGLKF